MQWAIFLAVAKLLPGSKLVLMEAALTPSRPRQCSSEYRPCLSNGRRLSCWREQGLRHGHWTPHPARLRASWAKCRVALSSAVTGSVAGWPGGLINPWPHNLRAKWIIGSLTRLPVFLGRMIKCVNFAYLTTQPLSLFPLPPPTPSIFPSLLPNFCCSHASPSLIKSAPELSRASFSQSEYLLCTYYVLAVETAVINSPSRDTAPAPGAYTWLLSVNLAWVFSKVFGFKPYFLQI